VRRDVPLRRSLLLRLLALFALVSLCSVAVTAWLAVRTTTGAIRHEQGQALADDARVYDSLLGYAATHHTWDGTDALVRRLAKQAGHRVTLTSQNRVPLADSAPGSSPLPANPTATIDPLAVDTALLPNSALDGIDPRAVGPFKLSGGERATLRTAAKNRADCLHNALGVSVGTTVDPAGRPSVETLNGSARANLACADTGAALDTPTPTEARALKQLNRLVDTCLSHQGEPKVELGLHDTWTRGPTEAAPVASAPARSSSTQVVPGPTADSGEDHTVEACLRTSRHEQLTPYVAPPVLLFISTPAGHVPSSSTLSPVNRVRVAAVTGLVLLITVLVTALAGIRLVRPLHALTGAAQRMRDGDISARVDVTGGDEIGRLAAAFNAMSERRSQLEDARKAMVSDVAHELRTPLSNIRGWLEAAEDGVVVPDKALLASLLEEALLLQHVIDDLQDLAAADAGELQLDRAPVNAGELLAQVTTAHRGSAEAAGISLTASAGDSCDLDADPVRLRQAVGNLVSNAVRHTPSGGSVTARAHRDGEQVVIEVADTGTGIAADDLPRVFERFWRAEKSRTRRTGGSGLGLSIVRKLVEAHGGTIQAASTRGEGSVFTLRLPAPPPGPADHGAGEHGAGEHGAGDREAGEHGAEG
jgi:two-component system, OmpR family, sensor histidine kinase BaeS